MVFKNFYTGITSKLEQTSETEELTFEDPLKLCIDIESPPCVLYGNALDSTGTLLSGILTLKVKDPYADYSLNDSLTSGELNESSVNDLITQDITTKNLMHGFTRVSIQDITLRLIQKITFQKPFIADTKSISSCDDCNTKITTLKLWNMQAKAIDLSVGTYNYPFSCLIPGSVPSTSSLGNDSNTHIKYELISTVNYNEPRRNVKDFGATKTQKLDMPIPVTRSIARGPDRNSLRVFPPTELTATAVLPNVVYPKSTFPLEMRIDGISSGDRRWRMRKLNWKIEETTRIRNYSCKSHKHELERLQKETLAKEEEKTKKPYVAIKRYGDIGPQITVSVGTAENTPIRVSARTSNAAPSASNTARTASNLPPAQHGDQDDDEDDVNEFVHPSDSAMRQEIELQQERAREKQLEQELKNDTTLFTEEKRVISKGEMKSGWKTDFDNNGHVEFVTDIECMALSSGASNPMRYASTDQKNVTTFQPTVTMACDIQDPVLGVYVNHALALEIVVAEEALQYANGQPIRTVATSSSNMSSTSVNSSDQRLAELSPMFANRNPTKSRPLENDDLATVDSITSAQSVGGMGSSTSMKILSVPTGAARVLRMQFRLPFTERSGLGISWDDEVPPIYQDVKRLSPPSYEQIAIAATSSGKPAMENLLVTPEYSAEPSVMLPQRIKPPPVARHHKSALKTTNGTILMSTTHEKQVFPKAFPQINEHL